MKSPKGLYALVCYKLKNGARFSVYQTNLINKLSGLKFYKFPKTFLTNKKIIKHSENFHQQAFHQNILILFILSTIHESENIGDINARNPY